MITMMSAVEKQLAKVEQEAEERSGKRTAGDLRQIEINQKRLIELKKNLSGLDSAIKKIKEKEFSQKNASDILETIFAGAIFAGASDIHFEPEEESVNIRFRIDGILNNISNNFSNDSYNLVLSRIKLLSQLKLNITDRPQDGQFSLALPDKLVGMRVSVVPSEYGETMVLRVLDPDAINISLKELGLRSDDLRLVNEEINRPNGMILNTGPTGSGKTTTLYSFLRQRRNPELKIITIEDPIEYDLEGIEQTRVNREAGYNFANGLSSIMRQDPDIILIGEIRDDETANTAIQSALTGHLVFSTIHANKAVGVISRFLDLNVKPASISPALNLIMAQRLVRRLCWDCRASVEPDADFSAKIMKFINNLPARINKDEYREPKIYKAVGCKECGNSGYKGRIGIFELLLIGKEIEELIEKRAGESSLEEFAMSSEGGNMVSFQQDGILKVLKGVTDFVEVEKATGSLQW